MFTRWLRTALSVTLGALLLVGAQTVPAQAANVTLPLLVNFQPETTTPPSGYTADFGQAYEASRGFGWTDNAGTAFGRVGLGRERNVAGLDKTLATLMHMALPTNSSTQGTRVPGRWRADVANGSYQVTVGAGDPLYNDSRHVINVEGLTAIDFTPTDTQRNLTQTVMVEVADGKIDIDSTGGTNTKIDFVEIRSTTIDVPTVVSVDPRAGATNVSRSDSVTVQLSDGVDATTLSAGIQLTDSNNNVVAGFRNTDAAASNATFVPSSQLAASATYTVRITSSLKTPTGEAYTPFTSTFTTGGSGDATAAVNFDRSVFSSLSGVTAMVLGPNSTLFAATGTGSITKYTLDGEGKPTGTPVVFDGLTFSRTITGLRFDSTGKLWISHGALCESNCPDYTGKISVLASGAALTGSVRDVITGLPRAVKDHMNNGIEFGSDGKLYIAQGSLSGYGAPDQIWGNRSEDLLSASILVADVNGDSRFAGTVNVMTSSPTNYNPDVPNAPVKVFATGIRNPFSITLHSNGNLYSPVNESASGNAPAGPDDQPPGLNDLPSYSDYFTKVVGGAYYGHPNPSRGFFRLNGGNPTSGTDPFQVNEYPVGTQPDAKWRKPDLNLGVHRSANGSVEFKSDVFGSNLKGKMLLTEYSQGKDVIAVSFDSSGNATGKVQVASGFYNPLAIVSDPISGRTYVGEYGRDPDGVNGQIALLSPRGATPPPTDEAVARVDFTADGASPAAGYTADAGQPYSATRKFGWVNSTGVPISLVGQGRDRNVIADERLDSFIHMQKSPVGRWQLDIANGTYEVNVGLGEPSFFDSNNVIRAEGNVIGQFTPTSGERTRIITAQVTVSDGKLSLDADGGNNTKIAFVEVKGEAGPVDPPVDPPPTGTVVEKVDFLASTTPSPVSGYKGDSGQPFSTSAGRGWEDLNGNPITYTSSGRERGVLADKRLDTFMHFVPPSAAPAPRTPGRYQIVVPNGTYDVTVGVGDPSYFDSTHVVRAEESEIVRFVPTTAARTSIVTAKVSVTDGRLTLDSVGGTNVKIGFVDVVTEGGTPPPADDTTAPAVTVTPSGTTNSSGAYVGKATVTIGATDSGSGVDTVSYTLDGAASQAYNAPFDVTAPGSHTVVATATDNAGNASAPVSKTFSVAAAPNAEPSALKVVSPEDVLGLGSRLVFSTVKNVHRPGHSITLQNTGTGALNVSGLTFGGTRGIDFVLCTGQPSTLSIPGGGSAPVCVQYRPKIDATTQGTQVSEGTLTITSNDSTAPTFVVTLGGLNAKNYESLNEPPLDRIAEALGWKISIPVTNKPQVLSVSESSGPIGDEVISAYWKKLDPAKSVNLFPLAHYAGKSTSNSTQFGWHDKGSTTKKYLYAFPGGADGSNDGFGQNQLLLPKTTTGVTTFNPAGSFGLVDGQGNWSDDNLRDGKWHNFRFFPAKTPAGVQIPGAWFVGDDIGQPVKNGAKNWDYQDYAFLLLNAQPDGAQNQPAPGALSANLEFDGTGGGIAGTGFTSVQGPYNAAQVSMAGGKLSVQTNSDTNTVHTNALQIGVNAGTNFRMQSRLVGPFDAINAGAEQQAIYFGPNASNYLKAELEWNASQARQVITIYRQQGTSGQVIASVPAPAGPLSSVDLRMDVTPSSYGGVGAFADIFYAVNGSATFTKVNTNTVTVPDSWITANTAAGIITSHQQGGAQFTAVYENFRITRRY